jgi:hypothetical protein
VALIDLVEGFLDQKKTESADELSLPRFAGDLVQYGLFKFALEQAVSRLVLLLPAVAQPWLAPIITFAVTAFMNYIYPVLREFIVFTVTDAVVNHDEAAYSEAKDALKKLDEQENPDAEALHKANDDFNSTLDRLGRMHVAQRLV